MVLIGGKLMFSDLLEVTPPHPAPGTGWSRDLNLGFLVPDSRLLTLLPL